MLTAGGVTCPSCGGFTLLPHCRRNGCAGRWCFRGECGWDSEVICQMPAAPALKTYPEKVLPLDDRKHLQPVVQTGTFKKAFIGGMQFDGGWQFDGVQRRPGWNPNELYAFVVDTQASIRALPGPSTW